ncbi:hypothetical protein J6590_061746 [Homalodisca vitripennis]|nr:hypothetical protein J6590_061746 [Homalodisca vitripennis]
MGKVKKIKGPRPVKNIALDKQIEDDKFVKSKNRVKERSRQDEDDTSEHEQDPIELYVCDTAGLYEVNKSADEP